jgi:hypothetical protein
MRTVLDVIAIATLAAVPLYLLYMLVKSVQDERRKEGLKKIWPNFGLGIVLAILFFVTWTAQAAVQWRVYAEEQHAHNEQAGVLGYVEDLGQATLENWQSEFLQLFSFVVLATLFIHRGSAESRDSEDRMEKMLDEIKKDLAELKPK